MTYGMLKSITTGLLFGDNSLPTDANVMKGLMQYALTNVATQADSLHLMTLSTTDDILRLAQGDYLIRVPIIPITDNDLVDIDEELTFAVARYLCSFISDGKGAMHLQIADRIIKDYNCKTYEITQQMQLEALNAGVPTTLPPSTEFIL